MKVIYVAGAYRSNSWNGVWENINHARTVARRLWLEEWAVICPHANTIFMDGEDTDGVFLKGDLEILRRCDAIYMLNNWKGSEGARGELELATVLDLEVYFEETDNVTNDTR